MQQQQQQQQPGTMFPVMPSSFPPTNITTEQIQKYLDENKKLIMAILDNQNLGKLAECAQYQAQLQKNLMYLAAIADAQPQTPTMPPQMSPHPAMQQQGVGGGFYVQHPQAAAMAQQSGLFSPRAPTFNNSPHQMQDLQHLVHPQANQVQMAPRPIGTATNGVHTSHNETNLGTGSSLPSSNIPDHGSGSIAHGGSGGGDAEEGK